jgi:hypothetical protein
MKNNGEKSRGSTIVAKPSAARAPSHLADFKYKVCFTELFIAAAVVN